MWEAIPEIPKVNLLKLADVDSQNLSPGSPSAPELVTGS